MSCGCMGLGTVSGFFDFHCLVPFDRVVQSHLADLIATITPGLSTGIIHVSFFLAFLFQTVTIELGVQLLHVLTGVLQP